MRETHGQLDSDDESLDYSWNPCVLKTKEMDLSLPDDNSKTTGTDFEIESDVVAKTLPCYITLACKPSF